MRIRRAFAALTALLAAALAAAVRLCPGFARMWSGAVARPALRALSALTARLPFALLEWGLLALALLLFGAVCFRWGRSGPRAACALLVRRILGFALAVAVMFASLWLPLYPAASASARAATSAQLIASCERLIGELNASAQSFARAPSDLPAKRIAFPFWMRAFGITGFFSFPTGEALVSPELPDCALPFVAVHERMHANGVAGEGAANIAAWEDCMERGGLYADSARIWALKYSMDMLYDDDPAAYSACRGQMSDATAAHYRAVGGGCRGEAIRPGARAAFSALGVGEAASDYEILALYLASRIPI